MNPRKVVSLFDGMGGGLQALKMAGMKVSEYHAFEIDKHAMAVAKHNHPEIIHHGSVVDFDFSQFKDVDLLLGGFPCQSFSFAGDGKGFDDERGNLFFDFVRAKEEMKPKYFLAENVPMLQEHENIISQHLDVAPVMINAALVSAQHRKRMYWASFGISQPKDRGIFLRDIVHEAEFHKVEKSTNYRLGENLKRLDEKASALTATCYKGSCANGMTNLFEELNEYIVPFDKTLQILDKEIERGKVGCFRSDSAGNRVYYINGKSVTLMGNAGGGAAKMGQYLTGFISKITSRDFDISISKQGDIRPHRKNARKSGISEIGTIRNVEMSKASTLIASHPQYIHNLFGCIAPDRVNKKQNGQRFNDGRKFYTLTAQNKHKILIKNYIRKLTPIECLRLQGFPDNYIDGVVSNTQAYKMTGNGWNMQKIVHIFNEMQLNKPPPPFQMAMAL